MRNTGSFSGTVAAAGLLLLIPLLLLSGCKKDDPTLTAATPSGSAETAPPKVQYENPPKRLPPLAGPRAGKSDM